MFRSLSVSCIRFSRYRFLASSFIKKTAADLKLEFIRPVKSDVFRFIETTTETYDFIFAGPPYALTNIDDLPRLIFERRLLNPSGWFVLEHTPRNRYEEFPHFRSARNYGTTIFTIFENKGADT